MKIQELKESAQEDMLRDIMTKLLTLDKGFFPPTHLLLSIINELDDMDCEDIFGTEGWKHRFGYDD